MTNGVFRQTEIGLDHSLSTSAAAREDRQGRGRLIGARKSGSENAKGGRNGRKMASSASLAQTSDGLRTEKPIQKSFLLVARIDPLSTSLYFHPDRMARVQESETHCHSMCIAQI